MPRRAALGAIALLAACSERFDFDVAPVGEMPSAAGNGAEGGAAGATGAVTGGASSPACSSDSDCGLASLHCDTRRGACVECVGDAHCPGPRLIRCDVASQRCVECGLDGDCAVDEGCEPFSRRCVPRCTEDSECGDAALACDSERGLCFECEDDGACERSPRGPRCLPGGSSCAACVEDDDCGSERCDGVSGECVECRNALDCDADDLCDPESHRCTDR